MFLGPVQADPFQMSQGRIDLPEIGPGAGHHDAQFGSRVSVEFVGLGGPGQLDRPLGMSEGSLAVGHHREMPWATTHPTRRAQLTDGFGPFTGAVGDETDGFPHDTDPAAPCPGGAGVPPGLFGFVVGESAGGHQVRGHPIGALLAQTTKVTADLQVQRVGGRPFGQVRPGLADVFLAAARPSFGHAFDVGGVPTLPAVRAVATAAVSGRWAGPPVTRLLATTLLTTTLLTTTTP